MHKKSYLYKKIVAFICAGVLSMFALSACGNSIPEMSEQESEKVGEYAALLMLKYDANHRSRLVDITDYEVPIVVPVEEPTVEDENQTEEPEAVVEEVPELPVTDVSEEVPVIEEIQEPVVNVSTEQFLGLDEGMSVIYKGYSWAKSYPDDSASNSYFSLDATNGKKFLIVHYTIMNQSGADRSVDFYQSDYKFKAKIEGQPTKTALPTILSEDMSTYMGNIANGRSVDVVLLFEEDENLAEALDSLTLSIVNSTGTCDVLLE